VVAPSPSQQWSAYGAQVQQQQQQQQFVSFAGYDANGMPLMADAAALYSGYPQQQQQLDQNQQYMLQQQQMMAIHHAATTAASVKPTIRFPPHFETQGGKYVFQPKSGCFLEPLSEFYFCPRSKLYYCAKDGTYFHFDVSLDPPFKRFEPPVPIEPEDSPAVVAETTVLPTTAAAAVTALSSDSAASALLGQLNGGALRTPLTLSLGGFGASKQTGKGSGSGLLSTAVGGASKRLKSDLLKWGALQADDEDEEEESQRAKGGRIQRAAPKVVATSAPSVTLLTTAELSLLSKGLVVDPVVATTSTDRTAPLPFAELEKIVASIPLVVPSASESSHSAASVGPAVCLLCRRQFASPEMLQRHERESKLHADNLRQSLLSQAQHATDGAKDDKGVESTASPPRLLPPPPPPAPPVYRNRALERRENQEGSGDGSSLAAVERDDRRVDLVSAKDAGRGGNSFRSFGSRDSAPPPTAAAPVAVFHDASNVGNALLRKMGWTDGSGLGRDGTGREEAVGVELAAGGAAKRGSMHATAAAAGPTTTNSLFQYKEGSYKESLLSATRARFEQISKK
jgi:hypothetical protein